jgi:pimeloyl-ACP methyl ester carboxylesterase
MIRLHRSIAVLVLAAGFLLASATADAGVVQTPLLGASGNFAGLVDIGNGRHLCLECRGAGGPTVVLEAGYRASGRYWSDGLTQPQAPRTMVLPGVSAYTHVCAYDRPGTVATPSGEEPQISRSDPTTQPRSALDAVADLRALLHAAGVPGPYVLAGHSLGGLMVRLYASTYPDEVVGLVLVDAHSERLETLMTPQQWAALVQFNVQSGSDAVESIPGYGDLETIGFGADNAAMRQAAAATPLLAMPLAVLAHGRPFEVGELQGFQPGELEPILHAANRDLATLAPAARFLDAADSGHDIHQDQPGLVTEAIRQVVEGVRYPDTWYDLTSCCAN